MPTLRFSGCTNTLRAAALTSRSPSQISPPSGSSRPAIRRSEVVLPQPLGPSSTSSSLSATSKLTPSSACTFPEANSLCTSLNVTAGMLPPPLTIPPRPYCGLAMSVNGYFMRLYHPIGRGSTLSKAPIKYTEHYKKNRVFVRAVESNRYTLTEQQREMRASVPRLIRPELGFGTGENWNIVQPGDEPFRSQSLHVHFVTLGPGDRNEGHGHQNEAFFYILEGGKGYEMH